METRRQKVFENGVLRSLFGSERDEVAGERRGPLKKELTIFTSHQVLLG